MVLVLHANSLFTKRGVEDRSRSRRKRTGRRQLQQPLRFGLVGGFILLLLLLLCCVLLLHVAVVIVVLVQQTQTQQRVMMNTGSLVTAFTTTNTKSRSSGPMTIMMTRRRRHNSLLDRRWMTSSSTTTTIALSVMLNHDGQQNTRSDLIVSQRQMQRQQRLNFSGGTSCCCSTYRGERFNVLYKSINSMRSPRIPAAPDTILRLDEKQETSITRRQATMAATLPAIITQPSNIEVQGGIDEQRSSMNHLLDTVPRKFRGFLSELKEVLMKASASDTLTEESPTVVENEVLAEEQDDVIEDYIQHDEHLANRSIDHEQRNVHADEIRSQPKPNGNWNPDDPLGWTKRFGMRSPEYEERIRQLVQLRTGDEGYHDVSNIKVPQVTIVRTKEDARIVVAALMKADPNVMHACDTEVMDIDVKSVGPVGNGYVTCVSIYSGPTFDYGLGNGPGTVLWIDNLDDAYGVLQEFKDWFENERYLKVWHNYGFDRHVMWNEGINVKGFGGDTMHMARLENTSRILTGGGYSLEALSESLLKDIRKKAPMKELFGVPRLRKDGSPGSLVDVPPVEVLQRDPKYRGNWIGYSCHDAFCTYQLRTVLEGRLRDKKWFNDNDLFDYYMMHMRPFGEVLTDMERRGIRVDARDYLPKVEEKAREDRAHHSKIFRDWAAKMIGPDGLALNPASSLQLATFLFGGSRNTKTDKTTDSTRVFKVPREELTQDALDALDRSAKEKSSKATKEDDKSDQLDNMKAAQLRTLCKEYGLKVSGKKAELQARLRDYFINSSKEESPEVTDLFDSITDSELESVLLARGLPTTGDRKKRLKTLRDDDNLMQEMIAAEAPKNRDDYVAMAQALEEAAKNGGPLAEFLNEQKEKLAAPSKDVDVTIRSLGLEPLSYTAGGAPSVTADVIKNLAGDPFADPPKYGKAFDTVGEEGCIALFSLCAIGSIDTMISNFLTNLQDLADEEERVHCSLNLNTETGRLSSRRPNLQNQPALEKDKYQIRKAFQSSPGNNLIVADYGQLELRILASMTGCKSMINAFASGGDFHSRTAVDMFDHIKEKIHKGECLLEWDYSNGDPPSPLVKDLFGSERRKAKVLNFSIAYGKTAHGLSEDFGVSKEDAQDLLQKWYEARPEVRDWQQDTKEHAKRHGTTRTLMGRYRNLPGAIGRDRKIRSQAERASINTPVQGGAADIAMMAMIKINQSEKLKKLGWILLLQIHDEVILEGPEETAEEAYEVVMQCMQEPWVYGLPETLVPLSVDGSYVHKNWFDAK